MNRLNQGAVTARITATILASAMWINTSLPVFASGSQQPPDANVKTLAPLPAADTAESVPVATADPPSADSVLKPMLEYTPPGKNSPTSSAAPHKQAATTDDAPSLVSTGGADKKDDAIAPAAAEVTDPLPLDSTSEAAGETKELAQATAARPRGMTDPIYNKLPITTGTVKIYRPFNLFPSNQIIHNLIFRDTPVKEVVADIARRGNLNIVLDNSVGGSITGDLHDLTLNEAMDTLLRSSGLQWRQQDNSTVIIGMPNALFRLGLNRPLMRVFKMNYASAFDVAQMLWASAFNRGVLNDFTTTVRNRDIDLTKSNPLNKTLDEQIRSSTSPTAGGGSQISKTTVTNLEQGSGNSEKENGIDSSYPTRPDQARTLRGAVREQLNEGTGFNSASTDPGSESIRSVVNVTTDYPVEQNGGGAIAIPDVKNRQVIVCGTQDDLNIAEEVIRLIDRRPRQVHIQSSLVEINNAGIRQLGASFNLQGAGASTTVLGGQGAPLVNFLPGLGSDGGTTLTRTFNNGLGTSQSVTNAVAGIAAVPLAFTQTLGGVTQTLAQSTGNGAGLGLSGLSPLPGPPANGFGGFLGTALPINTPSIAGITALRTASTAFNFLTLGKNAGGRANIATVPAGVNMSLNLVLQTNKAKLLANPSVVVDENTEALITLANEVVHKVTTTVSLGVVSTNVELVKAGIFLDVIPKCSDDGFITLRLRPQVSSPLGGPQEFANGSVVVTLLNVREVIAQEVRVKDGQTLVIGGLFSEQEAATLAKVPYLAEAPILGALFRNTIKGRNRTELMLLITPKLVEEAPQGVSDIGNQTPL